MTPRRSRRRGCGQIACLPILRRSVGVLQSVSPRSRSLFAALLTLSPSIALAQAYTPATIRQAYGFNLLSANYTSGVTGSGQTIAIIDAYGAVGSTNLYSDVNQFDS